MEADGTIRTASKGVGGRDGDGGRRAAPGALAKALAEATDSAGGYVVPVEVASDIARMVRARSAVVQLGPTVVPVRKELDLPALSSGAAAYYTAENAAIAVSGETFTVALALRPKALAAMVPVSNRLLLDAQTDPSIEDVIRQDLAEVLALRQDLAFLQGVGTTEPLGLKNTPGLTPAPSLGVNGGTPTFDNLKDMVAGLRAANAPFSRPGWVLNPRLLNTIEKVKDTQGRYLADVGLLTFDPTGGGGKLLGFPFRTTTQIPTNLTVGTSTDCSWLGFSSDWSESYIGSNSELSISSSQEASYTPDGGTSWVSSFQNDQSVLRAISRHDWGIRRPAFFTTMLGVRP